VPPHPQEAPLLQRLQVRSGSDWAELLPRLPAVLPQLLRLMRRENLSSRELVDLLSRDPSLVGELMRMANSAMYRPEREITDLASAVMVIGHEGLNQVVLRSTLRPIFNQDRQGRFSRQAGTLLWDLGERCSLAAMRLAPPGDERFAAYLAGLGAQVGMMALLRVLDALPVGQRPSLDREALHRQLLPMSLEWSACIVTHWGFPTRVAEALSQRRGQGAEVAVLAEIVREAHAVSLRHLMQPGLAPSQLGDWSAARQRAYAALEERFNGSGDAPATATTG
jgi:HD-like signal output (HDOD) protein